MNEDLYYIIEKGTNCRLCFGGKYPYPYIYDTEEDAKNHIAISHEGPFASQKTFVPISIADYKKKYEVVE